MFRIIPLDICPFGAAFLFDFLKQEFNTANTILILKFLNLFFSLKH